MFNANHFIRYFFLLGCLVMSAQAQSSQVFVSAKTGIDSGTCALANPCRNVDYALTQMTSGGRVQIMDSGDYNDFQVNKAATIAAAPGVVAIVTDAAFNGRLIGINIAPNEKVTLSGLRLDGQGVTQTGIGVATANAKVVIENCVIEARMQGVYVTNAAQVQIVNTVFRNSLTGVLLSPSVSVTGVTVDVVIEDCRFFNHSNEGVRMTPGNTNTVRVNVRRSQFQGGSSNSSSSGLMATTFSGGTNEINVEECVFSGLLIALGTANPGNTMRVSESLITGNTTGLSGSGILSRGNNTLEGNTTNGTFSGGYLAK